MLFSTNIRQKKPPNSFFYLDFARRADAKIVPNSRWIQIVVCTK